MFVRQFFHHTSSTYSYLLADNHEAIMIDPVIEHAEMYLGLIEQLDLKLVYGVDTHTHADHITALGKLRDVTGCVTMLGVESKAECVSAGFKDNEKIQFGKQHVRAIYTPGHTDDSYSFLLQDNQRPVVFTGDTLLIRGTGRTDFQNGDAASQYESLFNRLLVLPDETAVYPGHDYKGMTVSTIAEERQFNPRLQVKSKAEYIELMGNLKLPNPAMMDIAVPANLACGRTK